jgi:hypothetical protein
MEACLEVSHGSKGTQRKNLLLWSFSDPSQWSAYDSQLLFRPIIISPHYYFASYYFAPLLFRSYMIGQ